MPKLNERGVIAQFLVFLLLLVGLAAGIYLVQNRTNLFPKASVSGPTAPETSFSLVGPSGCTAGLLCALWIQTPQEVFDVKLYARSDLEGANLFTAKMTFPKDLVEVTAIAEDPSFITNWVEDFYDNATGEISLVGGVPDPGYKTTVGGESGLMATITFRAKAIGKGSVVFGDTSEILSNLNNINILTIKRPYDLTVDVKPSPTPTSIPVPSPSGSRVFVTSTTYNGNLGGLAGADAKCQTQANAANLGSTWKAWLSTITTSAASRLIHDTAGYRLLNGTIIANNWSDLIDGTLQNPINVTESGTAVSAPPARAWTNTHEDGSQGLYSDCNGWLDGGSGSTAYGGGVGVIQLSTQVWSAESVQTCSMPARLYCFEQPSAYSCDVNGDGVKDTKDGILITGCWNKPATGACGPVDVDKNGLVDSIDIQKFAYSCPEIFPAASATPAPGQKGDGNKDGKINLLDMSIIFTDWKVDINSKKVIRTGIDMNNDGLVNAFDYSAHRDLLVKLGVIRVK